MGKMGKKGIWVLGAVMVLALALCAAIPASPAHGIPPIPHAFHGTITIDGSDAAIGTVITAKVGGVEKGSYTTTAAGQYGNPDELDYLVVQDDIETGATIYFYANGYVANETYAFSQGAVTELNLTVTLPTYNLTTTSTSGGSVTTPGEGTFSYTAGTRVALVAAADSGYRFDEWTGDVGTVADVNAASTTITMNGDYSIAASFAESAEVIDEIGILRSSNGIWYLDVDGNGYWSDGDQYLGTFGTTGDQAVAGDWDGDGTDEIGILRPSNGIWYLDVDGNGYWSDGDQYLGTFGETDDQAVPGDWDGDGTDEIGILRPSNGIWYLDVDGNGYWSDGDQYLGTFGETDDQAVAGDWDGDGTDEIGIFRPSNGVWYLDVDGNGYWSDGDQWLGTFGTTGDQAVAGDWDGDGTDEIGIFRPSSGIWYLDVDGNGYWSDGDQWLGTFGTTGDQAVAGDWR